MVTTHLLARGLRLARLCAGLWLAAALSACTTFTHTNEPLPATPPTSAPKPLRASFEVDGERGNPRVLMFLALSGGGSRAAHLSAATMLRLQSLYPDTDLLDEVDVLSSVSGGSITAALYAASRDTELLSPSLVLALPAAVAGTPLAAQFKLDTRRHTVRCEAPLAPQGSAMLLRKLPTLAGELRRLDTLCRQAPLTHLHNWEAAGVLHLTQRNYLLRWFGNWLWPQNIVRYWFTAYDRGDIMAQTLGDNLYGTRLLGGHLRFDELNPTRPYLLLNATTATDQHAPGVIAEDEYAFGSVFTFTEQDFRDRLNSDLRSYSLARAVMASSAFPLVFPSQTLQDYRPGALLAYCEAGREGSMKCTDKQYLHVFDGGNSDNLGLKSIKRALLQMDVEGRLTHDRIVVVLIDAFTRPQGASRLDPDPRGPLGLLLDANVGDAVDALLQNNRGRLLGEFDSGRLRWSDGGCKPETRELPSTLCRALAERDRPALDLSQRLVFYHFGFDDVVAADALHAALKRKLDTIPTSFKLSEGDARLLDEAVDIVISPGNPCLQQIRELVLAHDVAPGRVAEARKICRETEGERSTPSTVPLSAP